MAEVDLAQRMRNFDINEIGKSNRGEDFNFGWMEMYNLILNAGRCDELSLTAAFNTAAHIMAGNLQEQSGAQARYKQLSEIDGGLRRQHTVDSAIALVKLAVSFTQPE